MPTYRVHDRDRGDRTVQAARVITDGAEVCFEDRIAGRWQSTLAVPVYRVRRLQRRVDDHDGRWRWIIALPQQATSHHAHFCSEAMFASAVAGHTQHDEGVSWARTG